MKHKLYKIFSPKWQIVLINAVFTIALCIYLFVFDKFGNTLSYVMYIYMSYSLVTVVMLIIKKINIAIEGNTYLSRYKNDYVLKHKISLGMSLIINITYGVFKFISGIAYHSLWFLSFGLYYMLITLVRVNLLRAEFDEEKDTLRDEYLKYRGTGIILLFYNIILSVVILVVVNQNIVIKYPGFVIYAVAAYTFYFLISSVVGLVQYRKYKRPIMSAAKTVSVVTALMAILSLEIAMLSHFGQEGSDFNRIMIMATGGGIAIIVIFISMYMIIKATEWLNRQV